MDALNCPSHQMDHAEASEARSSPVRKERCAIIRGQASLSSQLLEHKSRSFLQRHHPLLRAFAAKKDLRQSLEPNVGRIDADRLRNPSARFAEKQQQREVSASKPGAAIGRGEKSSQFDGAEMAQHSMDRPFPRNRQDSLDDAEGRRVLVGHVLKE